MTTRPSPLVEAWGVAHDAMQARIATCIKGKPVVIYSAFPIALNGIPTDNLDDVAIQGKVAMLDDFRTLELINDEKKKVYRSRMRQDKGHQAEWQVFQEAILGGGKPPIPYDQIYAVSLASIASVEALRSGKSVAIPQRPGS